MTKSKQKTFQPAALFVATLVALVSAVLLILAGFWDWCQEVRRRSG